MINPSLHDHFLFHLYSLGHLQNFRLSVIYFKEFRISLCLRRLSVLCFQGVFKIFLFYSFFSFSFCKSCFPEESSFSRYSSSVISSSHISSSSVISFSNMSSSFVTSSSNISPSSSSYSYFSFFPKSGSILR